MKISIRKNVFETNSSSTHAIMVQANYQKTTHDRWTLQEGLDQLKAMGATVKGGPDDWKGITIDLSSIDPELLEFGRTEEAYNQWGMKLLYAVVSFRSDGFLWGGLINYLKKLGIKTLMLPVKYDDYNPEGLPIGYIDHDSTEALAEIFGRGMSFEGYLTRKDVYLVIDNEG